VQKRMSDKHVDDALLTKGGSSDYPTCPVDAQCGGCTHVSVPYDEQLALKDKHVRDLFSSLRDAPTPLPIKGMGCPYHYRDKVTSPFAPGKKKPKSGRQANQAKSRRGGTSKSRGLDREVLTGMYQAGTHKLVPTDCCLVENEQGKAVVLAIRTLMQRHGVPPYNEDTGAGFMRHVVVRVGHESGEVLVTLVTNAREFPSSKQFCRELVKKCHFITTIVQNVNTRQTNVILGTEEHVLYGPGFILDTLCGLSFRISSQSFYQVNCTQTEVLYETAMDLAGFGEDREEGHCDLTAIDAYCGTGTIGLVAARRGARRVIGVESVGKAVADARLNARHNGVENATFVTADAGEFMLALTGKDVGVQVQKAVSEILAEESFDPGKTVLLMDPPRAGSSPEFLKATCVLAPSRIVYISCNPETQVRDLRVLLKGGYRIDVIQPVDMFPHTDHVETVVSLSKLSSSRSGRI
jgi:23S rRNA (uracil1939-C5)-methyltransferase